MRTQKHASRQMDHCQAYYSKHTGNASRRLAACKGYSSQSHYLQTDGYKSAAHLQLCLGEKFVDCRWRASCCASSRASVLWLFTCCTSSFLPCIFCLCDVQSCKMCQQSNPLRRRRGTRYLSTGLISALEQTALLLYCPLAAETIKNPPAELRGPAQ